MNEAYRQLRLGGLDGEEPDEMTYRLLGQAAPSEDERTTARLLEQRLALETSE